MLGSIKNAKNQAENRGRQILLVAAGVGVVAGVIITKKLTPSDDTIILNYIQGLEKLGFTTYMFNGVQKDLITATIPSLLPQ